MGKQITARTRSQLYFYAMREVVMVLKCCVHSLFQFHPSISSSSFDGAAAVVYSSTLVLTEIALH